MIRFRMMIISFLEVAFSLTTVAVAHDCSSPEDCMQTAGFNATVAIFGGMLGVVAAIYSKAILGMLQNILLKELRPISLGEEVTPGATATPKELAERVARAALAHPRACNFSVAQVANDYGITELDNLMANQQVEHMRSNGWQTVTAEEAQNLANQGQFVIAGRADPDENGHVQVVVPGEMVTSDQDGNRYPIVAGGAMNPTAYSERGHGVNHSWRPEYRQEVEYFVPPTRTQ